MKTMKFCLLVCAMAVLMIGATGCVSVGASYKKSYTNPLANGKQVVYNTNGVPTAPINGQESYEYHRSWDLNPFVWLGCGLKFLLGDGHVDNEIIVNGPPASYYPQQVVQGVYYSVSCYENTPYYYPVYCNQGFVVSHSGMNYGHDSYHQGGNSDKDHDDYGGNRGGDGGHGGGHGHR